MTQEQIFSGLKKDVRSLLISAKLGLTPDQLRHDYRNMLGHPMPLKLLGFHNVLDMVREMPDVVYVDYLADGSLVLKAVADDATRGIVELVAKQRMTKRSKVRRGSMGSFSPRYQQQRPIVLPRRGHAPPVLPAQLRAQLRQLLSQGPVGLSRLETTFALRFGFPLRVNNYGFYSIAEMLTAAADMILVTQSRTGSLLSLRNAAVQTPVRTGTIKPVPPHQTVKNVPVLRLKTRTNCVQVAQPSPQSGMAQSHQAAVPDCPKGDLGSKPEEDAAPEPTQNQQHFQERVIKLEEELRQRILENGHAGTVSPELKAKLRQVVAQNSEGISVHDLPAEYKRVFGVELPVVQSGFLSTTEMVGALNDTLYLRPVAGEQSHHWMVMDIQHDPKHLAALQPSEPEGASEGSEALNLSDTGYYFSCGESSWEGREEGKETNPEPEEEAELRPTTKTFQQMGDMYDSVPTQCLRTALVPLDAMRGHRLKPPTRRGPRELVPVLVEQVLSPSHFYIRFDESQEARAMENMMIEMRSCYTCPEVSERYRLPERYIRPGQVCCVAPQGFWFYRVVVHRVLNESQAEVYYVDFGDLTVVQSSSLKFLKSCYSELPAQAVPSTLAGIEPFSGSWSVDAKTSFQKLCCERTLVAALYSYHEDFLQLFLCDTHTEEDVYIHSSLITQGHGLSCDPGVSAALCDSYNPVSLYLGEGSFDEGLEMDEDSALERCPDDITTSPQHHTSQPQSKSSPSPTHTISNPHKHKKELPDLPPLEFIEVMDIKSTHEGGGKSNPFVVLQNKNPLLSCSEWDQAWTTSLPTKATPEVIQSMADSPEVVQSMADSPEVVQSKGYNAKQPPDGTELKQSWLVTKEGASPPVSSMPAEPSLHSTLKTLSLHTPGLAQTRGMQGMSVFPLFGAGDVHRVSSPLTLSSSVRLAASPGSHILNWYPHKRV
ncbi:hypothetical protein UPYG_G00037270 [Umbra pygmaea]|uniref:Tudor domain-containing protein 5 n=1 Tax=Umbra pygmaea TaxID=75934 RepID=A0ABD0XP71_UMBPY